jgi:transposase-like protein
MFFVKNERVLNAEAVQMTNDQFSDLGRLARAKSPTNTQAPRVILRRPKRVQHSVLKAIGSRPLTLYLRIRTTNRLERLNGEGHRRSKVIPRFPTERSCLALLFASLVTASKRWRGVKMTPAAIKQLQCLRAETVTSSGQKAVA